VTPTRRVVVVTGLYGAGKSTALHSLQELGYFCIDNLPTQVVEQSVAACEESGIDKIALGFHVGTSSVRAGAVEAIARLGAEDPGRTVSVLFLDASDEALFRRFNETRRPHPMLAGLDHGDVGGGRGSSATSAVLEGVRLERERLAPLRARATFELDTSSMSVHDLRRRVVDLFGPAKPESARMATRLVSFGYKYGIPMDANLLLDVRFVDNPYFVDELRPLTGLDAKVSTYVLSNEEAGAFLDKTQNLLSFCLPRYEREGKSYLTIGIGCTGGQHRSVVMAEELARRLRASTSMPVRTVHRDMDRASLPQGKGDEGENAT
jgi:RNase adapter protein RapZ